MKHFTLLLVACIVVAYHMNTASAQFSFSLPGKWGNGKRAFSFSLPGRWGAQGKRASGWTGATTDCSRMESDGMMSVYAAIQEEAIKMLECMGKTSADKQENSLVGAPNINATLVLVSINFQKPISMKSDYETSFE
ncbi:hypothetical protein CAPTEDRAFT_218901 [Capitella teleta]|uniref:Uncharacterized protein n=1 Tax=Capitella teleta TaxID=283909 RepID=R7VK66_CAPTE|nr:hypothetical protein CAPTEDRAFT_218901 [Capitella teleta]|eukprot:ELU16520.1 hypothetical protein CAPTEDRAFT_218901 [Capitella teleta]